MDASAIQQLVAVNKKHDLHTALLADMASKENLSELEEISQLFTTLDQDNDGVVESHEARKALVGKLPADQIETMIEALMSSEGNVRYTEFMGQMLAQKQKSTKHSLWKLFQDVDQDGSGYLDIRELEELLKRPAVAKMMAGRNAVDLMREMDDNNSGRVSWQEFKDVLDSPRRDSYCVGQGVEYYSTSHNKWIPCKVERVDAKSGSVMLDVNKNYWLYPRDLAKRVRPSRQC